MAIKLTIICMLPPTMSFSRTNFFSKWKLPSSSCLLSFLWILQLLIYIFVWNSWEPLRISQNKIETYSFDFILFFSPPKTKFRRNVYDFSIHCIFLWESSWAEPSEFLARKSVSASADAYLHTYAYTHTHTHTTAYTYVYARTQMEGWQGAHGWFRLMEVVELSTWQSYDWTLLPRRHIHRRNIFCRLRTTGTVLFSIVVKLNRVIANFLFFRRNQNDSDVRKIQNGE